MFVSEDSLKQDRLTYIQDHYLSPLNLFVFPVVLSSLLICVIPFVSVWAYQASLYFDLKRIKHKEANDSHRRLTIDQSIALRRELLDQDERFQKSLATKDLEFQKLQDRVKELTSDRNDFKFLQTYYGKGEVWNDVTSDMNRLSQDTEEGTQVVIKNELFSNGDPVRNKIKILYGVYQSQVLLYCFIAQELDVIAFYKESIDIIRGEYGEITDRAELQVIKDLARNNKRKTN